MWPVGVENVQASMTANNDPSLVSLQGIVPYHWCQGKEPRPTVGATAPNDTNNGAQSPPPTPIMGPYHFCPIVGVSGSNSTPLLVSAIGIMFYYWCQWME